MWENAVRYSPIFFMLVHLPISQVSPIYGSVAHSLLLKFCLSKLKHYICSVYLPSVAFMCVNYLINKQMCEKTLKGLVVSNLCVNTQFSL